MAMAVQSLPKYHCVSVCVCVLAQVYTSTVQFIWPATAAQTAEKMLATARTQQHGRGDVMDTASVC